MGVLALTNCRCACVAAAQQVQMDTETEAVRAVRAGSETGSCPARNGVAMGDQWVDREPR